VRCVFKFPPRPDSPEGSVAIYEERVTIWQAESHAAAIAQAEAEAETYVADINGEYVADGAEVFSLMRDSDLKPSAYLNHFFDTGRERLRA